MIFMMVIPADLVRLITFFSHLFMIVKESYPTVDTAELPLPDSEIKDDKSQ